MKLKEVSGSSSVLEVSNAIESSISTISKQLNFLNKTINRNAGLLVTHVADDAMKKINRELGSIKAFCNMLNKER